MERWTGRVALVTGASVGIGAAICKSLVQAGLKVVGAARGVEKVEQLSKEINGSKGSLLAVKCDVTKDDDVYSLFDTIKKSFGGIDICINNAGMSFNSSLLDGTPEQWRHAMDVNVIALCLCTKLAVKSMRERNIDDGQIINISSMSGHRVTPSASTHFYAGTKFAVKALTEGYRQELRTAKSHIRVSMISPGIVETEFVGRMQNDFEKAKEHYSALESLQAEDIANTVLHIISAPPRVEINDVLIRPTEQQV
ncbi:Dehydrogenase/reductase SDR family member 11 [Armadillidium vulgare]|nr:Dehydrogenase/reductase SDR family member 11 [Armadillidium vulgare]